MRIYFIINVTLALLLNSAVVVADSNYREIFWEDLIPEGAIQPQEYSLDELHQLDDILAQEAEKSQIAGRQFATKLAGQKIKLPAYVIPLDSDVENIKEFLLVPYFGACIHVPPPPPNQIVYGVKEDGLKIDLFDAIWVYGTLQIETINTDIAESGYSMQVEKVASLDWQEFIEKNMPDE